MFRQLTGKITGKNGKRLFIQSKEQGTLDYGDDSVYCRADLVETVPENKTFSLNKTQKLLLGIIKRQPLLPQWAVDEIVTAIEKVFTKLAA